MGLVALYVYNLSTNDAGALKNASSRPMLKCRSTVSIKKSLVFRGGTTGRWLSWDTIHISIGGRTWLERMATRGMTQKDVFVLGSFTLLPGCHKWTVFINQDLPPYHFSLKISNDGLNHLKLWIKINFSFKLWELGIFFYQWWETASLGN